MTKKSKNAKAKQNVSTVKKSVPAPATSHSPSDYSDILQTMEQHLASQRPVWRNHFNVAPAKGSVNKNPSMTQPDQSLTIRQLLDRFASGRDVAGFEPVYYGDFIIPSNRKLSKMDLADLEQIQADLAVQENAVNDDLQKYQAELKRRQHEEFLEAEVQKRLAAVQSPLPKDQ